MTSDSSENNTSETTSHAPLADVGGSYFTITTNPETAQKIKKQCEWDARFGNRSYKLGQIRTEKGLVSDYSIVQIIANNEKINPSDIFFLGLFAAGQ
jgi:hypothetical protein